MDDSLDGLADLEAIEVTLLRGVSPDEEHQRECGGQVAGQAPRAGRRTVDADRGIHSLHAYFVCHGDGALAGSLPQESLARSAGRTS